MTQNRQLRLEFFDQQGRGFLRTGGWTEAEIAELDRLDAGGLGRRLVLLPSEVLASGADYRAVPAIAGTFTMDGDSVVFAPRFPFVDGVEYSLLVDREGEPTGPEVWTIERPAPALNPTARVTAICPTAVEVPVNLLKVYIHFSAPMSEGWAGRAVKVRREQTGQILDGVFLPPEPELWDPERRRLTMLLDPGRIKRGLAPNLEAGYPLIEGERVRVEVDPEFRDAAGQPLVAGAERRYIVGPELRSRPKPRRWQVSAPAAGTVEPLVVEFDRPLDQALALRCLLVRDAGGAPIPGRVDVGLEECSWFFHPDSHWDEAGYQVAVDPSLEDLAGNLPGRVFDRDVTRDDGGDAGPGNLSLGFSCAPKSAPLGRTTG